MGINGRIHNAKLMKRRLFFTSIFAFVPLCFAGKNPDDRRNAWNKLADLWPKKHQDVREIGDWIIQHKNDPTLPLDAEMYRKLDEVETNALAIAKAVRGLRKTL